MAHQTSIYDRVLAITEDYLGPAAPRFLSRLATNHLDKPAAKITRSDLPQLIIWIRLAATMITDDELVVADYLERLEKLGSSPHTNGLNGKSSPHAAPA
jgi:hypothetical protein